MKQYWKNDKWGGERDSEKPHDNIFLWGSKILRLGIWLENKHAWVKWNNNTRIKTLKLLSILTDISLYAEGVIVNKILIGLKPFIEPYDWNIILILKPEPKR